MRTLSNCEYHDLNPQRKRGMNSSHLTIFCVAGLTSTFSVFRQWSHQGWRGNGGERRHYNIFKRVLPMVNRDDSNTKNNFMKCLPTY